MNLNKSEPFKYYISNWSFQLQGVAGGGGGEREQSIFNLKPPPQMLLTLRQGQVNPKGRK